MRTCWQFQQFFVYPCASTSSGSMYKRRTCAGLFWVASAGAAVFMYDAGRFRLVQCPLGGEHVLDHVNGPLLLPGMRNKVRA